MAVDYATLFTRLGRLVYTVNQVLSIQGQVSGTGTWVENILAQYTARPDLVDGIESRFQSFASAGAGWVSALKKAADQTIGDQQAVLNARSPGPADVLPLLIQQMLIDSQTVKRNTGTSATPTLGGGVTGNGVLACDTTDYAGAGVETIIPETVRFQAAGDRFAGASAGAERFSVTGLPSLAPQFYGTKGNGKGGTVAVANNGGNLLGNGGFDAFAVANTPDGWTIGAGVVGTNILQSTSTYHSPAASALLLQGNASAATVTLTQTVSLSVASKYGFGVWLRKGAGTFAAGSNLKISVYSPAGAMAEAVLYNADPSTLTTSYALTSGWVNVNTTVASDAVLRVTWTTAAGVASTGQIFIDDLALAPAFAFGGVSYALYRGSVDFLRKDFYTVVTAASRNGVFQTFFGDFYGVQLPSTSGTPSQLDALAT